MVALSLCARRIASPSVWCVPRSGQWWDGVLRSEDGLWWKSNFRMTKIHFYTSVINYGLSYKNK